MLMETYAETKKKYNHFSQDEREMLAIFLSNGFSLTTIAKKLKRSTSSISREVNRNSAPLNNCKYRGHRAHERYELRKAASKRKGHIHCKETRIYIENKIKEGLSPELIAGRIKIDKPGLKTNHESIYLYIYKERRDLIKNLVFAHKKRKKRGQVKNKRSIKVPNRTMIDKRPLMVNERKQYGHWEADTAISRASKQALQALVERKSRFLVLSKLPRKTAGQMADKLIENLKPYPPQLRRTITYDNGTENAEHERVNQALSLRSFFCQPYHSWEKGSVENVIGMVRRYLPKKTNFSKISEKKIKEIQLKINNRPRKCLGFRTPLEFFQRVALTY